MSTYHYKSVQWLPVGINEAWKFFSSARNLATITPPDMNFVIKTELNDREIYEGMTIEYAVSPLFKIPVYWKTEIAQVNRLYLFMDRQLKGPFALWEHTHTFKEERDGTLMVDSVKYRLPLGPLGTLAHRLLVRKRLEYIFDYRRKVLENIFN